MNCKSTCSEKFNTVKDDFKDSERKAAAILTKDYSRMFAGPLFFCLLLLLLFLRREKKIIFKNVYN